MCKTIWRASERCAAIYVCAVLILIKCEMKTFYSIASSLPEGVRKCRCGAFDLLLARNVEQSSCGQPVTRFGVDLTHQTI